MRKCVPVVGTGCILLLCTVLFFLHRPVRAPEQHAAQPQNPQPPVFPRWTVQHPTSANAGLSERYALVETSGECGYIDSLPQGGSQHFVAFLLNKTELDHLQASSVEQNLVFVNSYEDLGTAKHVIEGLCKSH